MKENKVNMYFKSDDLLALILACKTLRHIHRKGKHIRIDFRYSHGILTCSYSYYVEDFLKDTFTVNILPKLWIGFDRQPFERIETYAVDIAILEPILEVINEEYVQLTSKDKRLFIAGYENKQQFVISKSRIKSERR